MTAPVPFWLRPYLRQGRAQRPRAPQSPGALVTRSPAPLSLSGCPAAAVIPADAGGEAATAGQGDRRARALRG